MQAMRKWMLEMRKGMHMRYIGTYMRLLQQKDSAYFYFQKFVTLKDSLDDAKFKLQHLQKLALYKVESKEEQQQARIDLLHKDNQIKHQQLQRGIVDEKNSYSVSNCFRIDWHYYFQKHCPQAKK